MRLTSSDLQALGWNTDGTRIRDNHRPVTNAAKRESDLHDEILAYCRARRWPVVHSRMDVPQTAGIGTPDFVVALPAGRTVWVEAKAKGGKLRTEQLAWLTALRAVGHSATVVYSFGEFLEAVASLTSAKDSGSDGLGGVETAPEPKAGK